LHKRARSRKMRQSSVCQLVSFPAYSLSSFRTAVHALYAGRPTDPDRPDPARTHARPTPTADNTHARTHTTNTRSREGSSDAPTCLHRTIGLRRAPFLNVHPVMCELTPHKFSHAAGANLEARVEQARQHVDPQQKVVSLHLADDSGDEVLLATDLEADRHHGCAH
jgi:hypothetical protein